MVRRPKRIYTRVGGCPCCQCYRAVCAVTCRCRAAAASNLADARFSGDRGRTTSPDYGHTWADIDASGHHDDSRPTGSDEYTAAATGNLNSNADFNLDTDADTHDYACGLSTGS